MTLYMLFAGLAILIHAGGAAAGFRGAQVALPNGSEAAEVGGESARSLAVGRTLFQGRGCVDCHEPELCGLGPSLEGLFGSPVQDSEARSSRLWTNLYLREAILNPSATVAVGYPPIMPTFAGQLTEEELQALIVVHKVVERTLTQG